MAGCGWSTVTTPAGRQNGGVIIDCAIYREGHREETSHESGALADVIAALDETDGFLWIGLYEPSLVLGEGALVGAGALGVRLGREEVDVDRVLELVAALLLDEVDEVGDALIPRVGVLGALLVHGHRDHADRQHARCTTGR